MKLYPLVFSFRDTIAGNGFFATVSIDGRAMLSVEDDQDTWIYGVQPGGIAGGNPNRDLAFTEFKNTYINVLRDIAGEAPSFEEFNTRVTSFFNEVNEMNSVEWDSALAEVRKRSVTLADLKTVDAGSRPPAVCVEQVVPDGSIPNLTTVKAESQPLRVVVEQVGTPKPDLNESLTDYAKAA